MKVKPDFCGGVKNKSLGPTVSKISAWINDYNRCLFWMQVFIHIYHIYPWYDFEELIIEVHSRIPQGPMS